MAKRKDNSTNNNGNSKPTGISNGKPSKPNNRRGGRRGRGGKPAPKTDVRPGDTGYDPNAKGSNDLSWHVQSEQLLKESADLSYSYATGYPVSYSVMDANNPNAYIDMSYTNPGLAVMYDTLSLGATDNGMTPPMTYAANTLMQEVRSKIRPNQAYDAPDIAMLMGGMAEIYGAIAFMKRLIATSNMYATMNAYLPDHLFTAQWIDPTYLKEHRSDFVSRLNQLILDVNKIYIPNRMTLFPYIIEKYANYYSEGPSIKDQIYFWSPAMFKTYVYTATTDYAAALAPIITFPTDGQTNPNYTNCKTGGQKVTCDTLIRAVERMVTNVINNSDTPIICGDLENAFGSESRFIIPLANQDDLAMPTVNEEMLEMFMNSRSCGAAYDWYAHYDYATQSAETLPVFKTQGWAIQSPISNYIYSNTLFKLSNTSWLGSCLGDSRDVFINTHEYPTSAKTMLLSRYANFTSYASSNYASTGSAAVRIQTSSSLVCAIVYYRATSPNTLQSVQVLGSMESPTVALFELTDPFHYRPDILSLNSGVYQHLFIKADIVGVLKHEQQINMNRIDLLTLFGAYNRF